MFEFDDPERNEAIKKMIPDYRIKIIDPHQMNDSDYEKLSTEFGTVMKFISNARDKEKLKAMDDEKTLSRNSVEVINSCTGANIPVPEKDKVIKVSDGILGLLEEGRIEGRAEGKAEGRTEGREESIKIMKYLMKNYSSDISDDKFINDLKCRFDISDNDARTYLDEFLKD